MSRCAGRDREAPDLTVVAAQHERCAPDRAGDTRGKVFHADCVDRAAEPHDLERADGGRPDACGELRVVAEGGVRVERQVIGEERRVAAKERLEAAAEPGSP